MDPPIPVRRQKEASASSGTVTSDASTQPDPSDGTVDQGRFKTVEAELKAAGNPRGSETKKRRPPAEDLADDRLQVHAKADDQDEKRSPRSKAPYFTTKFTSLPDTQTAFTTVLPSVHLAAAASAASRI